MKFLVYFLFLPTFLFSKSIILNVDSKFNVPSEFKEVIENTLEDDKYTLIDPIETDVWEIETNRSEINCKKDSCYIELGEKFKADYLLDVHIERISEVYTSKYKIKLIIIDLKTVSKIKKIFYYKYKLSDIHNLRIYAKKIIDKFLEEMEKVKEKKRIEELNKIPKKLTKKDIVSMIREVYPEIKKCGKEFKYSGIIKIRFKVNNDGSITDLTFITKNIDSVKDCVSAAVLKMKSIHFRSEPIIINFPLKLD